MFFTRPDGSTFEIKDPSTVNFTVTPAPVFYEVIYKLLYKELDPTKPYPHVNFDSLNQKLFVWMEARYNVRTEINRVVEKKVSSTEYNKSKEIKALLLFFKLFPDFYIFIENVNADVETSILNAELMLNSSVHTTNFVAIKKEIDTLNAARWNRPLSTSESNSGVSIVGNISEKLLELAMDNLIDNQNFFKNTLNEVQSYGDFLLMCLPNNLWLSVKSNYARERLLASGYTTDIIGVGFFTEAREFTSQAKIRNFMKVGFLAMYVPDIPITDTQVTTGQSTYDEITSYYIARGLNMPKNINGTEFIRTLSSLYTDLECLLNETDVRKRTTMRY